MFTLFSDCAWKSNSLTKFLSTQDTHEHTSDESPLLIYSFVTAFFVTCETEEIFHGERVKSSWYCILLKIDDTTAVETRALETFEQN